MLGVLINSFAVAAGSIAGLFLKTGIPERVRDTVMKGIGLVTAMLGMSFALKSTNSIVMILSIALGGVLGEIIDIDGFLNNIGQRFEQKLKHYGSVSEGFVTATLIFCVGAMAIVGSIQSGLSGDNTILITKSGLDGITSIILSSTFGAGVLLSSISVLIYQGTIVLLSSLLSSFVNDVLINEMTAVGGLLIFGISLNILGITKIKVANLLPAIFVPVVYFLIF
ncbi:DUF554 domain-containing protein [Calorimonas adulescens]|uniref:DUF554 domain-containing protein n=1 Tax=Calorimonas adulescens TaxID=2606906 RepID=A0A5D8QFH3_9THEO|nr:DUF554 domain-containing protein [Calorimonas adulescens]TZE83177.1 DUF554 domain-containing protein [Calorimonas adulescens]